MELAGPRRRAVWNGDNAAAAADIGRLAGNQHPQMAAQAAVSQQSSMSADFDRALDVLLIGIQNCAKTSRAPRSNRRSPSR